MSITAVIDLELDNAADAVKAREIIEKYKGDASVSFDIMSKMFTLTGNNFDAVKIVDKLNAKNKWNIFKKKKKRWNATIESYTRADYNEGDAQQPQGDAQQPQGAQQSQGDAQQSQGDAQQSQGDAQQSQGDARALQVLGHNGYGYNNYYNPGHYGYGYNNYYNPGHNAYGYNANYYNPGHSTQTQYQPGNHNNNSNPPHDCVIS